MTKKPNILEATRSSCLLVTTSAENTYVKLNEQTISAYASQLDAEEVKASSYASQLPIKFDRQQSEITLLAMHHLIDFGSGYDPLLLAKSRRDAQETMQFAALGMHLGGTKLDANFMRSFSQYSVHNFCGFETHEDQPVPNLPGVTMSKAGPLAGLAALLVEAVTEAGTALQDGEGVDSLGEFILKLVDQYAKNKHCAPAAALVEELCEVIPAFSDTGLWSGSKVVFARKSQALVHHLAARFGKEDPRFAFSDISQLTSDSGSAVAAALRALDLITLSPELAASIDQGSLIASGGQEERALRASTVACIEAIVAAAGGAFTARDLSNYLMFLSQTGQALHGRAKKHLTPGTMAY